MLLEATTLSVLLALCSSAQVLIPKCCPRDEQFNNAIKCVKTRSSGEKWDWILDYLIDRRNNTTLDEDAILVRNNSSLSCSADSRVFLLHDFKLILTEEGQVHLNVLVYSTRDEEQWVRYEGDTFCMDAATRGALFCPCIRVPCVTKCCLEGYTFNATSAKCDDTGENDSGFWRPDFLDGAADEGYYIIENKKPKCDSKKVAVVPTSSVTQFNVSSNGNVKIPGYKNAIARGEYCGDTSMFLVCPQRDKDTMNKYMVYGILLLVAGVFLLASVLVNCCLMPHKINRKLHHRFLTAHNAALTVAYLATAIAQIIQHMTGLVCVFADLETDDKLTPESSMPLDNSMHRRPPLTRGGG